MRDSGKASFVGPTRTSGVAQAQEGDQHAKRPEGVRKLHRHERIECFGSVRLLGGGHIAENDGNAGFAKHVGSVRGQRLVIDLAVDWIVTTVGDNSRVMGDRNRCLPVLMVTLATMMVGPAGGRIDPELERRMRVSAIRTGAIIDGHEQGKPGNEGQHQAGYRGCAWRLSMECDGRRVALPHRRSWRHEELCCKFWGAQYACPGLPLPLATYHSRIAGIKNANANHPCHVISTEVPGPNGVGAQWRNLIIRSISPATPVTKQVLRYACGHPARLNYGDCFAYALARMLKEPLLFIGNDFAQTDITQAS